METELVRRAKTYAEEALGKLPDQYVFHNLQHTRDVAAAAEEIGLATKLSPDQLETVVVSAWLHDVGYVQGFDNHENVSADTAVHLLNDWKASEKKIQDVKRTIMATKMPQNPQDLLGEVLCDADLHHLANRDITEKGRCLRSEFAALKGLHFDSDEEWLRYNLKFFKQHT